MGNVCDFESRVFYQHEVYFQITRYEKTQSSCKRDTNISLELSIKTISSSTIFRGAGSLTSDQVMSPNKLFSCDCDFYATLSKYENPVYHIVRQGVKGSHLYEREGWKLKRTLPHYCTCTQLRFSDRMRGRIQVFP